MEDRQSEGLTLSVGAKVRLEAKRVYSRDKSFNGVERGTRNWSVLGDVTPVGLKTLIFKTLTSRYEELSELKYSTWTDRRTSFEPAPCRLQTHNQLEPGPPRSNMAPSTSAWPGK